MPVFAGWGKEEEAAKGSGHQGSEGQQWPLGGVREVKAQWGLGHPEPEERVAGNPPQVGWHETGLSKS